MLTRVQAEYNEKLMALRADKETIKGQTEQFHANLLNLQEQLE